ncbi:alpha-tocopherol transfer protein-like isoform X1 [Dermacentor variabilis]|uniref:alpha-tocopherol transfer protein-like isoform X1 n=1 Tax=Dermacentor variabilis TaxID=34621 RepID=UPI003F5B00E7
MAFTAIGKALSLKLLRRFPHSPPAIALSRFPLCAARCSLALEAQRLSAPCGGFVHTGRCDRDSSELAKLLSSAAGLIYNLRDERLQEGPLYDGQSLIPSDPTILSRGVYWNEQIECLRHGRKLLELSFPCVPELRYPLLADRWDKVQDEDDELRVPPEDNFLLMFLRTRKYKVQNAVETIRRYFSARKNMSEYFEELTTSSSLYRAVFRDHKLIMYANERDPQGRVTSVTKYGAWSSGICSIAELLRCGLWAMECHLLEEETQIRGFVGMVDLKGFGAKHLMQLTPWFVGRLISIAQDSLPVRLKGIYFVNTPAVFQVVYTIAKPFLSAKLKSRLHFIGRDLSELSGVVPSELLPEDFGGTTNDFDWDRQESFFNKKASYFDMIRQFGYQT